MLINTTLCEQKCSQCFPAKLILPPLFLVNEKGITSFHNYMILSTQNRDLIYNNTYVYLNN